MFKDNLFQLRKQLNLTQEALAGKIGVSRQAVAKWEAGVSLPDLEKGSLLAEALGVTLDDLINYRPEDNFNLGGASEGKACFRRRHRWRRRPDCPSGKSLQGNEIVSRRSAGCAWQ